ncbi:hypothetical protein GCM10023149_48490 [Mucilaginibacter gynuensis]|uniref:Uncharacterized protein n=1 Tax=Mucilaginibacter gynuensis TaxID=1302236 RepID=A0ABP8HFB3_9SPHI
MTKKEALIAVVSLPDLSDFELQKALIDNDVADGEYSKADGKSIDMAAIDILQNRIKVASESEGSFSISFNIEGAKAQVLALARKHGLTDLVASLTGQPVITSKELW